MPSLTRLTLAATASLAILFSAAASVPAQAGPRVPHFYKQCFPSAEAKRDTLYKLALIIKAAEADLARDEPRLSQVRRQLANFQAGGEPGGQAQLITYNREVGRLTDLESKLNLSVKIAQSTLAEAREEFDRLYNKPLCPPPAARAGAAARNAANLVVPRLLELGVGLALEQGMHRRRGMEDGGMRMDAGGGRGGRGMMPMLDFGAF